MGNARVFPSISHSTKNSNKSHRMNRTWEIGTHIFTIVRVRFSCYILILWYFSLRGKCMDFLINFQKNEKIQKNCQIDKAWEISSYTFSIVWVLFSIRFPCCGIFSILGMHGLPHQFPKARENAIKQ